MKFVCASNITHEGTTYLPEGGVVDVPKDLGMMLRLKPVDWEATEIDLLPKDGPTFEDYVSAGYKADNYPPKGFREKDTPVWQAYQALQARVAELEARVAEPAVLGAGTSSIPPAGETGADVPGAEQVKEMLDGLTVEGVKDRLRDVQSLDLLTMMRDVETNSKKRAGVLDLIDARMKAFAPKAE